MQWLFKQKQKTNNALEVSRKCDNTYSLGYCSPFSNAYRCSCWNTTAHCTTHYNAQLEIFSKNKWTIKWKQHISECLLIPWTSYCHFCAFPWERWKTNARKNELNQCINTKLCTVGIEAILQKAKQAMFLIEFKKKCRIKWTKSKCVIAKLKESR